MSGDSKPETKGDAAPQPAGYTFTGAVTTPLALVSAVVAVFQVVLLAVAKNSSEKWGTAVLVVGLCLLAFYVVLVLAVSWLNPRALYGLKETPIGDLAIVRYLLHYINDHTTYTHSYAADLEHFEDPEVGNRPVKAWFKVAELGCNYLAAVGAIEPADSPNRWKLTKKGKAWLAEKENKYGPPLRQ